MHKLSNFFLFSALFIVLFSTSIIGQEYGNANEDHNLTALAKLINTRLEYMQSVAAYKWENRLAIEDIAREKVVINASQEAAHNVGLDSLSTRLFFELQISLAKKIQQYWFNRWEEAYEKPPNFKDLQQEIRPELIRLGDEIITQIHRSNVQQSLNEQNKEVFIDLITVEGLLKNDRLMLFEQLIIIKSVSE